ncbi:MULTISPECIES: methyltransferase domain-containing protein [unclassified Curtobacterium]|uniref:methyltransferase domain-containing protein n=1 Tax=unclassified Curtobacterium TaxID=257496 RepID=UPI0009F6608E|nr:MULTISPECIES: methyltransferase domain-containing protein [unclassified Curtobacterium]WIA96745.1 methyltransferase domain-containing protein [Curtobacterium sp. MCBA15_004]WIB00049.1 methyltransferase domain-containing protein [Curtobacterium sp. MCBA15_012]
MTDATEPVQGPHPGHPEDGGPRVVVDRARYRRTEPTFARAVARALGDARDVLDLGAGQVPYLPSGRAVTDAGDPSSGLPYADDAFDAAVAAFVLAGWTDPARGLAEVRRVTRGPVVLLVRDPERVAGHWLAEYAPEVVAADARRWPTLDQVAAALGGEVETTRLPVPFTCVDGFWEAYTGRPERLLDPGVRAADPAWSRVDDLAARRAVAALRTALESGAWDDRHGVLRRQPAHDGSVVLVRADRSRPTRPA